MLKARLPARQAVICAACRRDGVAARTAGVRLRRGHHAPEGIPGDASPGGDGARDQTVRDGTRISSTDRLDVCAVRQGQAVSLRCDAWPQPVQFRLDTAKANAEVGRWLADVANVRFHGETKERSFDRFCSGTAPVDARSAEMARGWPAAGRRPDRCCDPAARLGH